MKASGGDANDLGPAATTLRALRLLRLSRTVKLLRYSKDLYLIVNGIGAALTAISWVLAVLIVLLFVCSIMLVRFIGKSEYFAVEAPMAHEKFGSIMKSMYTLFTVMTLEEWVDLSDEVVAASWLWSTFFIWFIFFT